MKHLTIAVAAALVATSFGAAPSAADQANWRGDKHVMPSAYDWLGPDTPSDTYAITIVRGRTSAAKVLRDLGTVRKELGERTPDQALAYTDAHINPQDYTSPDVVQVEKLGPAVVIYQPYGFRAEERIERLSSRSLVTSFSTTVEYDTYITVARKGEVIRQFDAGFKPPKEGALPEEQGLDWGARHQNIWATAWAFDERVSMIHISQDWFESSHPTYVLTRR